MVVQKAIFLLFFVSKVNLLLGNPFPQGNLLRDIDIWHKELKVPFGNSFVTSGFTSILREVRNIEIQGVTQQLLNGKSHDFLAIFALAHSKINQIA